MDDGSFLRIPAKRSIYSGTEDTEQGGRYGCASTNGSYKRYRPPPPPPLTVPDGHVCFRLLCHASRIGGLIGKSGNVIKQLQQKHSAKIRVDEAVASTEDRVIIVIASSEADRKLAINHGDGTVEASAAQEALLRVYEKILEVAAETDSVSAGISVASCRLLADVSQIGGVIGKGGKTIESIRIETGSRVRVVTGNKVSPCACPYDEMIEIEGSISAVKKGLVAVCRRLQDCPPNERRGRRRSDETREFSSLGIQEMTFRLLCSGERVGGVIGRGGNIIRALQEETGATISVGPSVEGSDERMISVTAPENPETLHSPAQNAAMMVFSRSVEAAIEKGLDREPVSVLARLVVPKCQVGCLLGRGGVVISEMRQLTRTNIRILSGYQIPRSALRKDETVESVELVQISGELGNVQDALFQVTGRLRDNLFSLNGGRGSSVWLTSEGGGHRSSLGGGEYMRSYNTFDPYNPTELDVDHAPRSFSHGYDSSPRRYWPSQQQSLVGSGARGNAVDSGKGGLSSAIVTNTTVEIMVPERVVGNIYGDNGSNLVRLRQISGAKVTMHDRPGSGERIVVISGTPDETQAAQSLLHAFILTGGPSS